ncbi:MAG: prepilin peptidase [Nanoarchaeota archaeon]
MQEYLFLYGIALTWVIFAVIQDVKTREIANWLTFSLIAFVLFYRAFFSLQSNNFMFFIYGLTGVLFFTGLGYLFYYLRVFAGGDAKLLFGLGGIFPYESVFDYAYYGFGFIIFLFTSGVIYTLIYSFFTIPKNLRSFKKSFFNNILKRKSYFVASFILGLLIYLKSEELVLFSLAVFIFLSPLLFAYVRAIESSCMVRLVHPIKLTEGDWLEKNVKVGKVIIKNNFQGLSFKEILLLRKSGKKVLIKYGVPFAPAFAFALILFFIALRYSFWEFF